MAREREATRERARARVAAKGEMLLAQVRTLGTYAAHGARVKPKDRMHIQDT